MTEETFGPTLPIMKVADAEEAITRANDSPYGLGASVFTRDRARGEAVARRIEAGAVCVNDAALNYLALELPMPLRLIKFALSRKHPEPRMFTHHEKLKSRYEVVIIGGGGHGCAAAYTSRATTVCAMSRSWRRATSVAATRRATPPSSARTI